MDLRVSRVTNSGVELFGYSNDEEVRCFIKLTAKEAATLAAELAEVPNLIAAAQKEGNAD